VVTKARSPRGWRGRLLNVILERAESDDYFCTESTETWLRKVRMRTERGRSPKRKSDAFGTDPHWVWLRNGR
jgi:hypothetical protein